MKTFIIGFITLSIISTPSIADEACLFAQRSIVQLNASTLPDYQKLGEVLSAVMSCRDYEKQDDIHNSILVAANNGSVNSQALLAEFYRKTNQNEKSLKWSRVLSDRGIPEFTKYLEGLHTKLFGTKEKRTAQELFKIAKSERHHPLFSEEVFNLSLAEAFDEGNDLIKFRASMQLGNLNLYNFNSELNQEFGDYGFSLGNARKNYDDALKVASLMNDKAKQASAKYASVMSYDYEKDHVNKCSLLSDLEDFYRKFQHQILKDKSLDFLQGAIQSQKASCQN
ncbi:MAG: hypothetical protein JXR18_02150 [Neptuniibacter sp.]